MPFAHHRVPRIHLEEALDRAYAEHAVRPVDRAFGTFLAYGVLRHWFLLQQEIALRTPGRKLQPAVRILLAMGLYQIQAMDRVPVYAVLADTMTMARTAKLSDKTQKFLYAVLQGLVRDQGVLKAPITDIFPPWWQVFLTTHYPDIPLADWAAHHGKPVPLTLRVNTLCQSPEAYHAMLQAAGIAYDLDPDWPEGVSVTQPVGDPRMLPGFAEGAVLVQDIASAQVAHAVAPLPGETILELGAAPGTKTTHLAALMGNTGRILAVDHSARRMARLQENVTRLGVSIVTPMVMDPLKTKLEVPPVDRILVDAPCSGSGTLRKHPEILLNLSTSDFETYAKTQKSLIQAAWPLLKPGGLLVYSTCSIHPTENQAVIHALVRENPQTTVLLSEQQILPETRQDGFYIATLQKAEDVDTPAICPPE